MIESTAQVESIIQSHFISHPYCMRVPILIYHNIARPARGTLVRGGFTPPARFARQLAYLKRRGFVFYTAAEMIEHYRERGTFPENGIALTLDDGWKDNYTNAFPVMKRL